MFKLLPYLGTAITVVVLSVPVIMVGEVAFFHQKASALASFYVLAAGFSFFESSSLGLGEDIVQNKKVGQNA